MLGELTFNVGIQRTSPRLECEPKVIWIWQPDCKSGLSGSGSSPQGPTLILRVGLEVVPAQSHKLNDVSSSLTPATKRVVRIELLRSIGSNPILPALGN